MSHSIILNKNTAVIVSLTNIYCPSDVKKKRTPTVYQNVTQYNNQEYNTAMTDVPAKIYCSSDLKQKRRPTVYQNVTQYKNKQKIAMIVSLTKMYCPSDLE